jgi:chemotaxis methyl-accepting protein methylase
VAQAQIVPVRRILWRRLKRVLVRSERLIYFDAASKAHVVEKLAGRLRAGGYLFVGHAESLNGVATYLKAVIPTVYTS